MPPPRRRYSDEATWLDGYNDFFGAADEAAEGWIAADDAEGSSLRGASAEDERGDNQRGVVTPPKRGAPKGAAAEVEAPVAAPVEAPHSAQGSPAAELLGSPYPSDYPRRRGYVRAASGYLYNSLPTLSGSASLKSTPLKQQG